MELIERYIFAVTRRLPEKKRGEIEQELRGIIEEMLEHSRGSESHKDQVVKVLQELGDPKILADNYREKQRCFIGPELIDKYFLVLRIVLGAVFIGITIATLIGAIGIAVSLADGIPGDLNVIRTVRTYIGSLFGGALQAFAWVTISFAPGGALWKPRRYKRKGHWLGHRRFT